MDIECFERAAPRGVLAHSRTSAELIGHLRVIEIADSVLFYLGNTD